MPPHSRDQAQQRADDIQAFSREVARLQAEQALSLTTEQLDRIDQHQRKVLAEYSQRFDIDPDAQARRLSLGMRTASLLGALALAASLLFFFYQFWGLFSDTVQVVILATFSVASLGLTAALRQRAPTGYFTQLAAVLAFVCFSLNVVMLGQIYNLPPSDGVLLVTAVYALLLAYACEVRLLLGVGLACAMGLFITRLTYYSGGFWLDGGERPEQLLPAGILVFCMPLWWSQLRFAGFATVYRVMGMLGVFVPILALSCWSDGSWLPWSRGAIEGFYQLAGFVISTLAIWLGARRDWADVVQTGLLFFVLFLFIKLFDWWWDLMPKYLFFLLLGLVAVAILVVLGRLRKRAGGRA